jgi:deoxyadenosine/deoxycytidine kinase
MDEKVVRIEMCGGIASGKTTLATVLQRSGFAATFENFEANPFWKVFYEDPVWHAFETELSFLIQHYHLMKIAQNRQGLFVCDFSLHQDRAYAAVTLEGRKLDAFAVVWDEIQRSLFPPALIIHLECQADVELERIRNRGRDEEKLITYEYLDTLNKRIEEEICGIKNDVAVLSVRSDEENLLSDERVKEVLVERVRDALGDTYGSAS